MFPESTNSRSTKILSGRVPEVDCNEPIADWRNLHHVGSRRRSSIPLRDGSSTRRGMAVDRETRFLCRTAPLALLGFIVSGLFDYTYGHSLGLILLCFAVLSPLTAVTKDQAGPMNQAARRNPA
jgi:hypothetical protein